MVTFISGCNTNSLVLKKYSHKVDDKYFLLVHDMTTKMIDINDLKIIDATLLRYLDENNMISEIIVKNGKRIELEINFYRVHGAGIYGGCDIIKSIARIKSNKTNNQLGAYEFKTEECALASKSSTIQSHLKAVVKFINPKAKFRNTEKAFQI